MCARGNKGKIATQDLGYKNSYYRQQFLITDALQDVQLLYTHCHTLAVVNHMHTINTQCHVSVHINHTYGTSSLSCLGSEKVKVETQ